VARIGFTCNQCSWFHSYAIKNAEFLRRIDLTACVVFIRQDGRVGEQIVIARARRSLMKAITGSYAFRCLVIGKNFDEFITRLGI